MSVAIPEHVARFLQKPNVAVLATLSPSGRPQVTPIWFMYVEGHILINTSAGRQKLRNMRLHPAVALAIVDQETPYRYVQIQGRVARFDTETAAEDIDRLSQRYTGAPFQYSRGDRPENRVSVWIAPRRVTAMGL
jgi:PPOX class probable F420-dependent enzyme